VEAGSAIVTCFEQILGGEELFGDLSEMAPSGGVVEASILIVIGFEQILGGEKVFGDFIKVAVSGGVVVKSVSAGIFLKHSLFDLLRGIFF
jgi:hypothetical protein